MPGEPRDNVGRQAIGEVFLPGIARKIFERQDRDGGALALLAFDRARLSRIRRGNGSNEAKTAAVHGLNYGLQLAVVADGLPGRADPAR